MNAPRCPYCRDRAISGTYGDTAGTLPVYYCPKTDAAGCPYGGQPVHWAAPVTDSQRAQAQEFEVRRDSSRRAAAAWAVREMGQGTHPFLWASFVASTFTTLLIAIGLDLDTPEYHLPRWLLILLAGLLFAIATYLRERHHATRREVWHRHLSPTMRPFKTALPQTATTPATTLPTAAPTPANPTLSAHESFAS